MIQAQDEPLAKLWGIEDTAIPEYLERERFLMSGNDVLKTLLNDSSFGGTYIDVKQNQIIINTVDETKVPYIKAAPKFQPYLNFSTFKPANRSLSSLKESVIQIILIANRTKVFDVITSISPQENNVVIIMLDEDKIKNRKFINAITPYGPKIEIIQKNKVISSQPEIDMSEDDPTIKNMLLCGDGLFNKFTKKRCSVGFFARAKNKTYVVTDEHCRDRTKREPSKFLQLAWNSTSAAAVVGSMLTFVGKPYDFGLIDTSNKSLTLKLLPSVRNTDSKKFRELNIENAILVSTHGAHLCKSGYTTHVTCGLIRAFSAIYMARSRVYFIDFILTNMLSIHGDSGGTTFRYSDLNSVILNGILYGGLGNFATLISPIDKILEYTGVEPITTNSTNSAI